MKYNVWIRNLLIIFFGFFLLVSANLSSVRAQITPTPPDTPPLCQKTGDCVGDLDTLYQQQGKGEVCTFDYALFKTDPAKYHLWIEDPVITEQGKADERARQFIYWVTTHAAIDNHPVLTKIWGTARNVSFFLVILTAALLGLGIIIGQRTNYDTGIKLWPAVTKIALAILYIAFSATIVITVIQLSEILMKFFIENLGGKDLFNIYFASVSKEQNYVDFVGCRDINIRVQESVQAELFMLKLTNWSYYFMGGMLLIRQIVLWFLLFVSPFLAILLSFAFIKNTGKIWIGVFFQWVLYGPLLALFLGGTAMIWKYGIPFIFDFSRVNTAAGYIYPTAINITYGGPAQTMTALNNANYIDTFVEYIITVLMLWAVTILPWWLLRIYRDYCCEGINAMKNIMMYNLNPGKGGGPLPNFPPANIITNIGETLQVPRSSETTIKKRIETVEEIKKTNTEDISRSLDIKASNLTDIAHFETNRTLNETANKNINYLKNPIQASTPAERQKFMNIRSELSSRASRSDTVAKRIISTITTSTANRTEQTSLRQSIITSLPKTVPANQTISSITKLSAEKVQQISSSLTNAVVSKRNIIDTISQKNNISPEKTTQIINLLQQNINIPVSDVVQKVSSEVKLDKEKVTSVIKDFSFQVRYDPKIVEEAIKLRNVKTEKEAAVGVSGVKGPTIGTIVAPEKLTEKEYELVKKKLMDQYAIATEPDKNIEKTVEIPQTVSIDEYENVKKMWMNQYENGEVPITENIKTRESWIDKDIIFIINTLNKLLSSDNEIKQQGLDEVGYILPIFLVNNLTGEQLVAYLKAKVEAAKEVKELMDREKDVTEKLKAKSEEEMVDVVKPKEAEKEKTMEMKEEMKEEPEDKSKLKS